MDANKNLAIVIISTFLSMMIPDVARAICLSRNSSDHESMPIDPGMFNTFPSPSAESVAPSASPSVEDDAVPISPASQSRPAPLGLEQICKNTDHPELCIASINPFFGGTPEPVSVLGMAIKAATMQAKLAIAIATKMARAGGVSRNTATALQDCSDQYQDAIDNLRTAMGAIKARDMGTINSMLSAVVTDSWTCDEEFSNRNPLAVHEEKLSNLASNCLAIASLVKI